MFGYELIKTKENESRNDERRKLYQKESTIMENILNLRMILYQLYPNDIEKISSLFQSYDLE